MWTTKRLYKIKTKSLLISNLALVQDASLCLSPSLVLIRYIVFLLFMIVNLSYANKDCQKLLRRLEISFVILI